MFVHTVLHLQLFLLVGVFVSLTLHDFVPNMVRIELQTWTTLSLVVERAKSVIASESPGVERGEKTSPPRRREKTEMEREREREREKLDKGVALTTTTALRSGGGGYREQQPLSKREGGEHSELHLSLCEKVFFQLCLCPLLMMLVLSFPPLPPSESGDHYVKYGKEGERGGGASMVVCG